MEFGVEDDVADALALEDVRQELGLLNGGSADQHRLLFGVQTGDLVGDSEVFFLRGAIDHVGVLKPEHLAVGRRDDNIELVDLVELGGLRLGGSGHAGEFLIEPEVVLEGNRGERLVLLADGHAFLGFNGLVKAIGPAAARHQAPGKLVDNDDFAVLDDVFDIQLIQVMGLDGDFDMVFEVPILWVGDVADAEQAFYFLPAFIGDGGGAGFLVDDEVAGPDLGLDGFDEFAKLERGNDGVDTGVLVGGLVGGAGDNERGAGLVDENGVHLVDDAEVLAALDHVGKLELHVVAQIIEAELVVGAISDVGGVSVAALGIA